MLKVIELLRNDTLFPQYKGLIAMKRQGPLMLLDYTLECEARGKWDEVTNVCRGLIVDTRDWSVTARPFDKFHNVGTHHASVKLDALPKVPFRIFEKIDGSLGILFKNEHDAWQIATRSSFDSTQAVRGTAMLHKLRLEALPADYTPIFVIVYPKQHSTGGRFDFSVIEYDYEALVLLGLRHRVTGDELLWEDVVSVAHAIGARLPKTYEFSSFEEVFAHAKQLPQNEEGYVVLFANGMRVKVKGTAYVNLNSGIWGVSEKTILEALKTGGQEAYLKLVAMVPEEMRALADQIVTEYTAEIAALQEKTHALLANAPSKDPRKTFAAWVYANVQPSLRGAIFALADGKSLNWFDLARSQH